MLYLEFSFSIDFFLRSVIMLMLSMMALLSRQSLFNVLDQFESAKLNTSKVDDPYDEVEPQLKRTKREKIESEQSVKQACTRIMMVRLEEGQE